jgi:acyl-CoA hydrolase
MIAQSDLKDLGVHSEMFCDAFFDLYKAGKITNMRKKRDTGRSVFTFTLCTKETMDFLDNNPLVASYNCDYVTNTFSIAQEENMFSINSILELDLVGQAVSESIGATQYSGTGGALSFTAGSYESKGGTAVLCFLPLLKIKRGNSIQKLNRRSLRDQL